MSGWTYEVHELSEGFSAIVYDENGHRVADHLTEEQAALIAVAPEMAALLRQYHNECSGKPRPAVLLALNKRAASLVARSEAWP